jgi:predicted glycosyltransferase
MIKQLQKNNTVLCTTRDYREVNELSKLQKMNLKTVGRHGGTTKPGKLDASLNRSLNLGKTIEKFKPDLLISLCSPEASRVAFGLGIRHIAFCDSPHASAVMKLTLPFVQKLLIPWIISKKEFTKYGISEKNIIPYKAIDASVIVRNALKAKRGKNKKKRILIRIEEEQASYTQKNNHTIQIIQKIANKFPQCEVMILPRYKSQIVELKKTLKDKVKILDKVAIGSELLQNIDVFVGSGGTMTAESALSGVPTISYNAVPNLVQDYLVRRKLVVLESNPNKIISLIDRFLSSDNKVLQKNAKQTLASMEDPYKRLIQVIKKK